MSGKVVVSGLMYPQFHPAVEKPVPAAAAVVVVASAAPLEVTDCLCSALVVV